MGRALGTAIWVLGLVACEDTSRHVCPPGQITVYRKPGCGADAVPSCAAGIKPCAQQFCSCDGKSVIGCDATSVPFRHAGTCE